MSDLTDRVKARRTRGGAPCPKYEPKNPEDYGYGSCKRCGWAEPEHVSDELLEKCERQEDQLREVRVFLSKLLANGR